MNRRLLIPLSGLLLAISFCAQATEKTFLLAAFDFEQDTIELEVENQAQPGCFLNPYELKDVIAGEFERLGFTVSDASPYVLSVVSWGVAIDDYHCAVVLDTVLNKRGVSVHVTDEQVARTDIRLWETSDILTGPKFRMQDRLIEKAIHHANGLHISVSAAASNAPAEGR